jgi:hypothetical protein
MTYAGLSKLSPEELENLNVDMLILDEFHHIGAPVWGEAVNRVIDSHKDLLIFGMSAYSVRDRGTQYERDMAEDNGNELFSDKIVSRYDLVDAIVDGVLPVPVYKSAYINLLDYVNSLEKKVTRKYKGTPKLTEQLAVLRDIKRKFINNFDVKDLLLRNIKKNGKYIYFCPSISVENENDIHTIMDEMRDFLISRGYDESDFEFYFTTGEEESLGKKNRNAFYHDVDLDGKLTSRDVALIKTHVLTDNATITDPTALSLLDINGDGSTSYAKDHKILDRLLNPSGNNTSLDTYAGDSLGNWTFDVNKRKFYCDLSTNMITSSTSSEYYIYLINDKDSYEICYTYETYDGYIRIYARNLPKNNTNINIVIVKKESYPLDTISGVNLHLVARGSSSVTSPSIKCLFAVGSENGGTSAEMGIESSTLTTSYADYSASSAAMATAINNYIAANNAFPTISATLTTSGTSYA